MAYGYNDDTLYRLWCVLALGAGSRAINDLLSRYGDDPGRVYAALSQDEVLRSEFSDKSVAWMDRVSVDDARSVLEKCFRFGIKVITPLDECYPKRLESVFAPPQVLFVKGDISPLDSMLTIGVVGTRKPSEYSRQVADAVVTSSVKRGMAVVSGFAEGIDISAALTAVRRHGKTFAVIGCGIDVDYPKSNSRYREMIASNGAIISEFPPGTDPLARNFPQRNRILSGLSDTLCVIEAGEKSGSLNTASHAAEQGKTVFAVVPGDLFDVRYKGQAELIRDGAVPFMGMGDIFDVYENEPEIKEKAKTALKPKEKAPSVKEQPSSEKKEKKQGKTGKARTAAHAKAPKEEKSPSLPLKEAETELGKRIAEAVRSAGSIDLEGLSEIIDCDTDELLSELTMLELDNIIINEGTRYVPGK
ncbi:MAG: DNA-processing protein DprA [Oscillospiraceae bacterium]|nr:DNA-processing protein DprA [Oscillospiraceae bacterium]